MALGQKRAHDGDLRGTRPIDQRARVNDDSVIAASK